MKSEEKSIQAISAQAHSEAADNRLLRKKLQARDKRVVELEAMVSNLNRQLCEKVDQLNDMMQKLVSFMTGNGEVNLSDSLREAVVAGVRAEFEAREQKLKETYASELEKLTSDFNARLAAKQNEINQLKGINDGDNPTTTMPSNSNSDSTMSPEAKLKASEQQKANLQVTAYGQHTESGKFHHGSQQTENADDLDFNGEAPIYKCYDVGELIQRIACLVHMRRPFFKLKDFSEDAMMILKLFEVIFREDKLIKAVFTNPDDIRRERALRIAPMFNDLKSYLDKLAKNLEKEEEPELLKAVNYALTEYPCMLRCLEDGSLDLSNNVCERQIRRIAKYRNNSYFVGSPESGVRFARLMSHFANIRKHNLDPVEYLCDVFRRIKKTAKDKLVDLLAHRWQLATVTSWA